MTGAYGWLIRRVFNRIDAALVISKSTLDQCLSLLPSLRGKSVVSWNGLSCISEAQRQPKKWDANPEHQFRLYSMCRLVSRKNIAGALRALAIVRARKKEKWEYIVGGDGDDRAQLEALSYSLGLADKVRFLGRIDDADVWNLYRQADLFLHPQTAGRDGRDIEGFGLVIVDAMAFGVPVLAGRDGAPSEYIRDGETAYLVDGNDIPALSAKLESLIGNTEELQRVGSAGRLWALRTLTWEQHIIPLCKALGRDPQKEDPGATS
jgi:phosphatidylinositol alpha-1,6-mannosyltransferase